MAVVSAMISFDFSKTVEHISKLSSFAFLWGRPWHAAAVFYEWAKKDSLGLISWVGVAFSNSGNSGQKDAWSFPLYSHFNVFSKIEFSKFLVEISWKLELKLCMKFILSSTTVWRALFDKVKTYCWLGDIFYPPPTRIVRLNPHRFKVQ